MSAPDRSYEVGKGKPPAHSRWKKGQSGNPSGRPKRQMSLAEHIEHELETCVTVNDRGKKKLTKRQLIAISLVNKAVRGDLGALKMIQAFMATLPPEQTVQPDTITHFTIVLEEDDTRPHTWETDSEGNVVSINQPRHWMRPKRARL